MRIPTAFDEFLFNHNKINDVFLARLYFCTKGRNAWHSTWIKRYLTGSIKTTIESAKEYCESLRGNGNTLYINEIPALIADC
jgi:hypothetical protein